MALVLDGSANTIAGLAVGGLPDGSVDSDTLASGLAAQGITHLDTWLLTADKNWSGGNLLDADVSRSTLFGNIGDPMTKSSSTFTFPATGIWELDFRLMVSDATENAYAYAQINYTTNNGTSWAELVESADAIPDDGSNATYANPFCHVTFDVTDASTHKIQLRSVNEQGAVVKGNSTRMFSGCVFKRIGDT